MMYSRNKRISLPDTLLGPSLQVGEISNSLYADAVADMKDEISEEEEARCDRDTSGGWWLRCDTGTGDPPRHLTLDYVIKKRCASDSVLRLRQPYVLPSSHLAP